MHKLLIFNDKRLLRRALTHRSYVNENFEEYGHNERLEFLGDSLLNFISAEYLYGQNPEMAEDEMTRRRSALVDEKQLARFAKDLELDFEVNLGQGARKEGGRNNPNILSSTFEAVVGAYYLDNNRNIEALSPLIEQLFESVPKDVMVVRSSIDSKNKLQEFVQANGATTPPKYETEQISGMSHAPEFLSKAYVNGKIYGEGKGRNKKEAEKEAAADALSKLKKRGLL
jgi:ribonuclease-3